MSECFLQRRSRLVCVCVCTYVRGMCWRSVPAVVLNDSLLMVTKAWLTRLATFCACAQTHTHTAHYTVHIYLNLHNFTTKENRYVLRPKTCKGSDVSSIGHCKATPTTWFPRLFLQHAAFWGQNPWSNHIKLREHKTCSVHRHNHNSNTTNNAATTSNTQLIELLHIVAPCVHTDTPQKVSFKERQGVS